MDAEILARLADIEATVAEESELTKAIVTIDRQAMSYPSGFDAWVRDIGYLRAKRDDVRARYQTYVPWLLVLVKRGSSE